MKNIRIFVCLLFATACSQKSRTQAQILNNCEALINGKWVLISTVVNPPINGGDTDLFGISSDCIKDDTLIFKPDSTLVFDRGKLKCAPDDPQQNTLRWKLNGNALIVDGKCQTIETIDAHYLQMRYTQTLKSSVLHYKVRYKNAL